MKNIGLWLLGITLSGSVMAQSAPSSIDRCVAKLKNQKITDQTDLGKSVSLHVYASEFHARQTLESLILSSKSNNYDTAIQLCSDVGVALTISDLDQNYSALISNKYEREYDKSDQ